MFLIQAFCQSFLVNTQRIFHRKVGAKIPHLWHQGEGGDGGELGDDEAEDEAGAGPGAVTAHHHRVLVPGGSGQASQVTLQLTEVQTGFVYSTCVLMYSLHLHTKSTFLFKLAFF